MRVLFIYIGLSISIIRCSVAQSGDSSQDTKLPFKSYNFVGASGLFFVRSDAGVAFLKMPETNLNRRPKNVHYGATAFVGRFFKKWLGYRHRITYFTQNVPVKYPDEYTKTEHYGNYMLQSEELIFQSYSDGLYVNLFLGPVYGYSIESLRSYKEPFITSLVNKEQTFEITYGVKIGFQTGFCIKKRIEISFCFDWCWLSSGMVQSRTLFYDSNGTQTETQTQDYSSPLPNRSLSNLQMGINFNYKFE